MTDPDNRPKAAVILRQKAETLAREQVARALVDSAALSPEEIRKTIHELRVHQIELEMQNEELRRAQEEIEAGRVRYFDLYDLAPVGYITLSEQGLILEANLTAATLLGTSRGLLVKQPISRFICKDDQDIYYLHRKQLFETGKAQECELRLVSPDGSVFWVHLTATSAQMEDGARVSRMVINNISERKQAEAEHKKLQVQLAQARKMEYIGRLAGGVAHDFNNMLGIILGYTDMILEQMDANQPFRVELMEIRKAGLRSADLTRQLLAFACKQTATPKVINLNDTLEGLLKVLRRLIGEDIELTWQPGRDVWPVKVDPAQIDQILTNLCVNAREAIAGVGKMTIETGNTVFDEAFCKDHEDYAPGAYVMLTVSDNGYGMDSETISHLFEPFFTTKDFGKGTGLGLASVYGVIKQNNGFISVSSDAKLGTTFSIYLPRYLS